ncbi:MAG: hypothetical protein AB7S75_14155 [Desulfococcaceae bacterium]
MTMDKKYRQIADELDRIVRAELNRRAGGRPDNKDLAKIGESIEIRNREIVEAHQQGKTAKILPQLLSAWLRTREGGDMYAAPDSRNEKIHEIWLSKKERLETLIAAAVLAADDKNLIDLVSGAKKCFEDNYRRIKELLILSVTAENIRKEADMTRSAKPKDEESAVAYLREIAPLRADLETIRSRHTEAGEADYIREAVLKLGGAIHSADRSLAEKSRNAAKYLFDQAASVFHSYQSTPAAIPNAEIFNQQKEILGRYAGIFREIGDTERQEKIGRFISAIEATLEKLQKEIEKQKESEARTAEKAQKEISEAYERFLEIKEAYAQGMLSGESQQKNAGEKLKKYRDILIANGQRIVALDLDRFINATGIGRPENSRQADSKGDDFDYRKGFLILLPITIVLLLLVFVMIVT